MTDPSEKRSLRLTTACWPVFEFLTNFIRQVKHDVTPSPEEVRYEALAALRDAQERVHDDVASARAWEERIQAMLVYLIDYKMINTEWPGQATWRDTPFETDPTVLDHPQTIGGEEFFHDCDELQREYEIADRRERRDADDLAEQLSLYFVALRLGFAGKFHDRPQELAEYTRRLFTRLPAYALTRGKEMFSDAYEHNQEVKIDYNLGMKLSFVLAVFVGILLVSVLTFRVAWSSAVGEIADTAKAWKQVDENEATSGS